MKEIIKMGLVVYLYGSGKRCEILLDVLRNTRFQVAGIIDSCTERQGSRIGDYTVTSPRVLLGTTSENVCITFFSPLEKDPIWDELYLKYGVDKTRIMSFHQMMICAYVEKDDLIENIGYEASMNNWKYCFDMSWKMGLGGVESWLYDLKYGFTNYKQNGIRFIERSNNQIEGRDGLFEIDVIREGINRIISLLPCTIVFSRVNEMLLSAYLLKKKFPELLKIIMSVHGACDGMYKDILSYCECIDYYVCVSGGIKRELVRCGIDVNKISVMTIPVGYKCRTEGEYSLDSTMPIRLGYAGRLEVFHKRADYLIKLIEELEKRGICYKLSVAGEGSMYATIKEYIDKCSLGEKIKLLGRVDRKEIKDFWHEQDIALNLSDSEGRPLSNLEAMASGCVPIVTCTPGSIEDVKDGVNGFVVPKGDVRATADRIDYLNRKRECLPVIGQQARKDIIAKISMENHLSLWINLFQTI